MRLGSPAPLETCSKLRWSNRLCLRLIKIKIVAGSILRNAPMSRISFLALMLVSATLTWSDGKLRYHFKLSHSFR